MALENVAQFFGFAVDTSGLAPAYVPGNPPTAEAILASYDPARDTALLRQQPELFEQLRSDYDFRHEPLTAKE